MAPPTYERIPLEAEDHEPRESPNGHYPPTLVKPTTYYGEGEFDPPSSDDEEEGLFLEKGKQNDVEREGEAGDALNEDLELVVGGHKVLLQSSLVYCNAQNMVRDTKDPRLCAAWSSVLLVLLASQRSLAYSLRSHTKAHHIRSMVVST